MSSATANTPVTVTEIDEAETQMHALGQTPLFMIRDGDAALDALLADRRYVIVDPVIVYLAPLAEVAASVKPATAIPTWPPLALQREIWADAGIGPARLAVMERVDAPKTAILGRDGDTPAGTAFAAIDGDIAMLHAIEVAPEARRKGVATRMLRGAANWAAPRGAAWLTVVVTDANDPAKALYRALGMTPCARYHYRRAPEACA